MVKMRERQRSRRRQGGVSDKARAESAKGQFLLTTVSPVLRERLENWGDVMRVGLTVGVSQTWKFCERLARLKGQIDAAREPKPERDDADADKVERAWRSIAMPPLSKQLLVGWYVMRLHPGHLGRLTGIRQPEFDSKLYRAHVHIESVLAIVDNLPENRAQSRMPATGESSHRGEVPLQELQDARQWRHSRAAPVEGTQ